MQKAVIAFTVFLSILLESAVFRFLPISGVVPNITMILVICFALHKEADEAAFIGLLAGLIKDITVGRIIGISAITFMILAFLTGHYNHKIFAEHITTPVVITMAGTLFHESLYLLFVFFLGYQVDLLHAAQQVWIVQLLYNLLVVIPVYAAVRRLLKWPVMKKQY